MTARFISNTLPNMNRKWHWLLFLSAHLTAHGQRILPIGEGVVGLAHRLEVYDNELIVAGQFSSFNDHPRLNIQGWGSNGHNDLPGAFESTGEAVFAMERMGAELICGGIEWSFGHIAKWNGSAWSGLGGGFGATVRDIIVAGETLIACGDQGRVMSWNGQQWTSLMDHGAGTVRAICMHQGNLFAGTTFPPYLLRLNSGSWEAVNESPNASVNSLLSTPDGLVVGGQFTAVGGASLPYLVRYASAGPSTIPAAQANAPIVKLTRLPGSEGFIAAMANSSFIIGAEGFDALLPGGIRAMALFNQERYLTGSFDFHRVRRVRGIGRIANGRDIAYSDASGIKAAATPTPALFHEPYSIRRPGFEAPIGSGLHAAYFAAPWLMGLHENMLHGACTLYELDPMQGRWRIGPTDAMPDDFRAEAFGQVWKIDRFMIQDHLAHHSDAGYVPRYEIASYPGNSYSGVGALAPFVDVDADGHYDPLQGDYPAIRGDQSIYRIINDSVLSPFGFGQPMGVELHIAQSVFFSPWAPHFHDMVLVNMKFVNRSSRTYEDVRFGMFLDFDIGGPYDDAFGCDSILHAVFGYNAAPLDVGLPNFPGYGDHPPAIASVLLNEPMRSCIGLNRTSPSSIQSDPASAVECYSLLRGLNQDGLPITEPGGAVTTFMYHGDPNSPGSWVFPASSPAIPDGNRAIQATGPFSLPPGASLCFDIAFVLAKDSLGGHLGSVALLKERINTVRSWYRDADVQCDGSYGLDTGLPRPALKHELGIHPNPATDRITITGIPAGASFEVLLHDGQGRLVQAGLLSATDGPASVMVGQLRAGFYHLLIRQGSDVHRGKFIIAR